MRRYASRTNQETKRMWTLLAENASSALGKSAFNLDGDGAMEGLDELVRRVLESESAWYIDSSNESRAGCRVLQSLSPDSECMLVLPLAQARHHLVLLLSWTSPPTRPHDTADFASDVISSLVAALTARDSRRTERAQLTFSNVQAQ